ncbi:protein-glutamate O-methyltransferase CheR [Thalassospira profundimaris]|uniref:protein-glutamate O-methyltransferase n=1 Tax=Thalassospira profundimaris TaxID=502049 RepID=A0A367V4W4_9PROT|nr:protein-glutamate O-methyltransferase [Thalassospira profundimaris]KZB73185.1 chemotaxis protein CheR [Thalassospira sp. MCCC 1A01148]MBR9902229.1 protein-glutamate O-methyltransferase [Rhodospirillales bacterium]RCK20234.1 chemotaxis protein CheR [Thalassospira profundimaris]
MMKPEDFEFISRLIKSKSGLVLSQDKTYLLESRLMPIARKRGLKDLTELIGLLRGGDRNLVEEVVDAMTTNESFFFRDTKPFDQFRHVVLPHMIKARASKKHLRIWCAAASSGQEPYSLAMILDEFKSQLVGWRIDIVGTDISREILTKARAGLYSQFEVQRGLPIGLLVKYFQKKEDQWQISADIRSKVQYKEFNLLEDFRPLGQFDVVYCRNVLIYFDQPTKSDVLARISALMPDDGFLFLGGAETVLGISDKFKPLARQRGIYQLNRPGAPDVDLAALEKAQAGAASAGAAAGAAAPGGLAFPKPKHMQTGAGAATGTTARPAAGTTGTTGTATTRPATTTRPASGTGSSGSTFSRPSGSTATGSTTRPGSTGTTGTTGTAGSTYRRPLGTGTGAGGTPQRPRAGSSNSTGSSGTTRPSPTFDRSRFGKPDDKK